MGKDPEHFIIEGGRHLGGKVVISGSKNLVPSAMAAALLTSEDCVLENVPRIGDVEIMADILKAIGAKVEWRGKHTLSINAAQVHTQEVPSHLAAQNRGSFVVTGPLLTRFGETACPNPGGDIIGTRPIDVHLTGFRALGARLSRRDDKIVADTTGKLQGSRIFMDYPSNTGTENLLMAATLASGETILQNAACEPEIMALSRMLKQMGAKIEGEGTRTLHIEGVKELHGTTFPLIPDRAEAGTYAVAAAITGGEVLLQAVNYEDLDSLWWKLQHAGVEVLDDNSNIAVRAPKQLDAVDLTTSPYPGFSTDLQPIMTALLTQARGVSMLHERVFNNRLLHVIELRKMGAKIVVAGQTAVIVGPTPLTGTRVRALDIRSGAALILAGLSALGKTRVDDIYHVDRGYEGIVEKLQGLGAKIEREVNQ